MSALTNVAVYGTLKRGEGADQFLKGCNFLGHGRTVEPFVMRNTGGFPVVLREPGEKATIMVEAYAVPPEVLAALDRYESNGRMFVREIHDVQIGAHNSRIQCHMYLGVPGFWKPQLDSTYELTPKDGAFFWTRHERSVA